jgi:hypothetical protein
MPQKQACKQFVKDVLQVCKQFVKDVLQAYRELRDSKGSY